MKHKKELVVLLLIIISFVLDDLWVVLTKNIYNPAVAEVLTVGFYLPVLLLVLLLFSIILYNKDKREIQRVWHIIVVVAIVVFALKYLIQRPRPIPYEGIILPAFPSMHAALAFATTPFIQKMTGKKWVWVIPIVISLSRLYVHYLSDLVVGAFVGYYIAITLGKIRQF